MDENLRKAEREALIGGKTAKILYANAKRRLGYLEVKENLNITVTMDSYLDLEKRIEPLFSKENLYYDYSFKLKAGNRTLALIGHRMETEEEYTKRKEDEDIARKEIEIDKQIKELQAKKKALKTKAPPKITKAQKEAQKEARALKEQLRRVSPLLETSEPLSRTELLKRTTSSYLDYLAEDEKRRK